MRFIFLCILLSAPGDDQDQDLLPDKTEQELLDRFIPGFYLAADDCDVAPSEFERHRPEPVVKHRNGTIYGQAFRVSGGVELHYYHLWSMDCGKAKHPLDVEHVSALLTEQSGQWRARYWYAAAHEDTVCDRGSAGKASLLYAEWRGPEVWISRGKHASFFTEAACRAGCGSDRCDRSVKLNVKQVVNLGEANAALNGSTWLQSSAWPLTQKMQSDFPDTLRRQLDQSRQMIAANPVKPPIQPAIAAGSSTVDAIALANTKTESALSKAKKSVKSWLSRRLP